MGPGGTVSLTATVHDPDGGPVTYQWEAPSGSFDATDRASVTWTAPSVAGPLSIRLTVTDDEGEKWSATVTVTVRDEDDDDPGGGPGGGGPGGGEPEDGEPANRAPATAEAIADPVLRVGAALEIDLADAFDDADGDALDYEPESSDETVATVEVDGDTLTVRGRGRGTAEITVTATDPDGETAAQTFAVTVTGPETVWYLPPASDPARQGFVRVLNHSDAAGEATVTATDDAGNAYDKGLTGATGPGEGGWRLAVESDTLTVEVLAYMRTPDGFVTGMNATAPLEDGARDVAIFNPASNVDQVSLLRLVNRSEDEAEATVTGVDDAGASPGSPVLLTLPAGSSCTVDAQQLESGSGLACGDEPAVEPGGAPDEPVGQGGGGRRGPVVRGPVPGGLRPARAAGLRARSQPLDFRPHGHDPRVRRLGHALRDAAARARRGGDGPATGPRACGAAPVPAKARGSCRCTASARRTSTCARRTGS